MILRTLNRIESVRKDGTARAHSVEEFDSLLRARPVRASKPFDAVPGAGSSGDERSFFGNVGGNMDTNDWNSDLMTVAEIAGLLHVPVSWVYERTRRRGRDRIPHVKLGKYLRFEIEEVRSWFQGMRRG